MTTSTRNPSAAVAAAFRDAARTGDLGSAALRLSSARIPVFPCVPGSKQPLTAHGFQSATTDKRQVVRWWQRTPNANIGIPTGRASGLVVVDVDVHRTGDGYRNFSKVTELGLTGRWAWMVRTPSGGMHAYFGATPGVEQRSWAMPSRHIDFRGDGGYIIAPPSAVINTDGSTKAYELISSGARPGTVDSTALKHLLAPPKPPRLQTLPPASSLPVPGASPERLAAWVASRPEGGRNGGLFWAACRMAEAGHNFNQTAELLGEAAATAGLADTEAFRAIKSAYRTTNRLGPSTDPSSLPGLTTHDEGVAM